MADERIQLALEVEPEAGTSDEEVRRLTADLRRQLLQLSIDDAVPAEADELPRGAKGDPLTIGGLILTLAGSPELIKGVFGLVQSWLSTRSARSIAVTIGNDSITISGARSEEQQRLVELFLERHRPR